MTEATTRLAAVLSVDEADLHLVPEHLLAQTMDEMHMPKAERAQAHVTLAKRRAVVEPRSATKELVRHLEEQEKRAQEPWRVKASHLDSRRARYKAEDRSELQRVFADLAKNNMLSVAEAMIGTYTLFGSEDDLRFFSALLCREQACDRVRAHNFFVAEQLGPDFLAQYGPQLLELEFPLFPSDDRFSAVNQRLLREVREVSGGATPHKTPSVYRGDGILVGGSVLPVIQSEAGPVVDVSVVEAAFDNVFQQLRQLQEQMAAEKASAGLVSVCGQLRQQVVQAQRAAYGKQPYMQPQRGRGMTGRGRGGTRGRGSAPQWGGDDESANPKNGQI